jgi:hypothetical protein
VEAGVWVGVVAVSKERDYLQLEGRCSKQYRERGGGKGEREERNAAQRSATQHNKEATRRSDSLVL